MGLPQMTHLASMTRILKKPPVSPMGSLDPLVSHLQAPDGQLHHLMTHFAWMARILKRPQVSPMVLLDPPVSHLTLPYRPV